MKAQRRQFLGTFFLRNRPALELLRRISDCKEKGSTLKIAIMGCSNGAEVYSIVWTIRSARPDLRVVVHAMDISEEALACARRGVYTLESPEVVEAPIFERLSAEEIEEIFERENGRVKIKSWIKEGISWHLGDAGDPNILNIVGSQDIVVANNFLCHMEPPNAERCLRNISRIISPGGYLFVTGVDLDVRTTVARDLGWEPMLEMMEEIHDGDPVLRNHWPFKWWGLEPLDKRRDDWQFRYASVFQLN